MERQTDKKTEVFKLPEMRKPYYLLCLHIMLTLNSLKPHRLPLRNLISESRGGRGHPT